MPLIHHRAIRAALLAGGMAAILASNAQAVSVITYTDEVVFLAASGATSATGALPAMAGASAWTGSYSSRAFGSVTVSAPSWVLTEWTDVLPGTEIAVSNGAGEVGGVANDGINATFAAPVYSAGFRFYEPQVFSGLVNGCNVAVCVDSTFEVRLMSGANVLATVAMPTPTDQAVFFGVWSDQPFTSLAIRELSGSDDNELYGEFFTGTATPAVPEPSTAALWLLGLAVAVSRLRTTRR